MQQKYTVQMVIPITTCVTQVHNLIRQCLKKDLFVWI